MKFFHGHFRPSIFVSPAEQKRDMGIAFVAASLALAV